MSSAQDSYGLAEVMRGFGAAISKTNPTIAAVCFLLLVLIWRSPAIISALGGFLNQKQKNDQKHEQAMQKLQNQWNSAKSENHKPKAKQ